MGRTSIFWFRRHHISLEEGHGEGMTLEQARELLQVKGFTFDKNATDTDDHGRECWRRETPKGFNFCDSVIFIETEGGFVFQATIHGTQDTLHNLLKGEPE